MTKMRTLILLSLVTWFCFVIHAKSQVASIEYHIHRTNLNNCFTQFTEKENGRVAFLGGSITHNPGWRDSVCQFLQKSFPKTSFDFIAAGIPSMGSTPGAFRLERDILSKGRIDLLFVEAAVNDPTNGRSSTDQIRGMEGILRHARKVYSKIDIITMYFVDPGKIKSYREEKIPEVIMNHEKATLHYNVSSINLAKEVTDRIDAGEFTWKDDFKDLHPSPFGQMIYYHSIKSFLGTSMKEYANNRQPKDHVLPEIIDEFSYDAGVIISIDKAEIKRDWEIIESWKPADDAGTRKGYVDVPMLSSSKPESLVSLDFKGKAIGIAVAAGPDAGKIEYQIDNDGPWKEVDLFTKWSSFLHLPWYYVLEDELSNSRHTIYIKISNNRNEKSKGNACRIKHFFINE